VSRTLDTIKSLVLTRDVRISEHGYDELAADGLSMREVIDGVDAAIEVEDYPVFHKGPCVLSYSVMRIRNPFMLSGAFLKAMNTPQF